MRNFFLKVFVVVAITAAGMFGADNSIGTWKLNAAKSKSTGTNALKTRTEAYEVMSDGLVKITRSDQRADGTSLNYSFTFRYDGKEYPVTGALFDTIAQTSFQCRLARKENRRAR